MTTLDIGSIVRVDATIAPSGRVRQEFGRTLFLTPDITLPRTMTGRASSFATLEEVAQLFPKDSEPYRAASVYFNQSPYPRNLVIGRWVNTPLPSVLNGGAPRPLVELTGQATVVAGTGTVAELATFYGRATVLTGGSPASLVTFHGRATVLTGGNPASLVTFHGRATVLTGGNPASLVTFHGRATVLTGGNPASLVTFHGRATVLTGGNPASLVTFHGRATVVTGTGTVASLTTLQGITSGTVTFLGQTLTGLDFSSDTDLDAVASTLQTALRATSETDLDQVEVAYDGTASAFVVTIPLDSTDGTATSVSAAFTGDNSDELGLDTATIVNGVDALKSGSVTFLGQSVTSLDFSAVTDYDAVASTLQTALRATSETDLDQVEVAYDGTASAFVVTIPLDSTDGTATSVSAAFTGDNSDELGLDTATVVNGVDAIKSGTVTFLETDITGLDFGSVTTYDAVASTLQTALRATSETDLDQVEVAYDSTASAFVVTIPLDSDGEAISVSAAFTGDNSDELGLDTATVVNGVDAIKSGTVTFLETDITGLDFGSVTTYDAVASVLQTALRATSETDLDQVEVAYDGTVFVVTLPVDSSTGVVPTASAAFTGDDSDELGLDTATIVDGVDAIKSGSVAFLGQTVTSLDFSAVTDYDAVASTLQTALRATSETDLDQVEVAYDGTVFVVTLPLSSTGTATTVDTAFTGDNSDELGLDTATIVDGVDAIRSGSVTFLGTDITGLDFGSATTYDGVAGVLQTALRGASIEGLDEVEVVYQDGAFMVTIPLDSQGVATAVATAFTGDTADELGLDSTTIVDGLDVIKDGSVTFLSETVTGLDFSLVTGYDEVASVLQAGLRDASIEGLDAVVVVYGSNQFVVTIPLASDGSATTVTDPFTGDTADDLGLDSVDIAAGVSGIGDGALSWQGATISGLDFTGATSYSDVAQTLQTALQNASSPGLSTATVVYGLTSSFQVVFGYDATGDPHLILGEPTDVAQSPASALGVNRDTGATITQGEASEAIDEAMEAIKTADDSWYFVTLDNNVRSADYRISLSQWVENNPYMLALDVVDRMALAPNENTSVAARLSALQHERTFLVWSDTADYKALSTAARLSSVDFGGRDTLITPKFKKLPGNIPDTLNARGQRELDRKRVNYYTRFGADAIFAEGWTLKPGRWIDVLYWLDWIVDAVKHSVRDLLVNHPTRVPQTDPGIAAIKAEVERVCQDGVRNGGIAPGTVSETVAHDVRQTTGNRDFSGHLTRGFLVHVSPVATMSEADRVARRAPPMKVWLKGSGAVHFADIQLVFVS